MKKEYVLLVLIISVVIFNVPKSYANNKLDSIELKENNEINKKAFAMYVENSLHEYEPYTEDSNYFPNSLKYHYNGEMSKCVDNNDQEVDGILTHNEDNSVTVTSNRTVYCYLYFDLDKEKPNTPIVTLSNLSSIDNNYTNSKTQTVTITYNDEDIESYCISLNSETCEEYKTEGLNNIEKTITIKDFDLGEDGNKTISVWLKDLAGNISDTPKTINIILDTKAPEINNLTVDGTTTYDSVIYVKTSSPSVTLTWSNDDVARYCMSKANCEPETSITGNTLKVAVPLNDNAANTIHAKIMDKAGNVSVDKTYNLTVDTKISDISKVHIGGSTNPTYVTINNPTVYIEWPDSDIIKYCVVASGTCTPSISVSAGAKSITTAAISLGADGTRSVNVVIQDRAGNTKSGSDSVIVDTTNPTYNLQKSGDYTNQIVINTNANDVTSGIQSVTCSATKGTCSCTGTTNAVCTNSGLTGGVLSTITVTIKDKAGKSVTPNTTQTTKIDTAAGYIESKAPSGLNKTIQGGMWRYQGAQGSVNNYICFGTDNKTTCTSNPDLYMYRIIGIVKDTSDSTLTNQIGAIKIIKQTPLTSNSKTTFTYHSSAKGDNYAKYIFGLSLLKERLNGQRTSGSTSVGFENIFLGTSNLYNKSYPYLNPADSLYSTWIGKILSKNWWEGDIYETYLPTTAQEIFNIEHGLSDAKYYRKGSTLKTGKWTKTTDSFKIGLMCISDYYWSTSKNGSNCYSGSSSEDCKNSWLNAGTEEWLLTHHGRGSCSTCATYTAYSEYQGSISNYSANSTNAVRPTFYLINTIKIKSGIGSESDPFIIQV